MFLKRFINIFFIICVFLSSAHFVFADNSDNSQDTSFNSYLKNLKQVGAKDTYACNQCPDNDDGKYYQLTTGLPFPGMGRCSCIPKESGLPLIITMIIRFIIGSVGTVATIIFIIAGFMWAFSAGNTNTVKTAKGMMMNSVIGLVLTVFSGAALKIINPTTLKVNYGVLTPTPVSIQKNSQCRSLKSDMPRGSQVCAIDMNNSFLTSGSKFSIKWKICDINGGSCSDVQEITEDKAKWPGYNSKSSAQVIDPICTNITDMFGRFSVVVDSASGIGAAGFNVNCGTDESGPKKIILAQKAYNYCLCRSKDSSCVSSSSTYCAVNSSDGACKSNFIGASSCLSTSVLSSRDQEAVSVVVTTPKKYEFKCTLVNKGDNVDSDYAICNSVGENCTPLTKQNSSNVINPMDNPNMKFSIKMINPVVKNALGFTLKCNVPKDNSSVQLEIDANIIKKIQPNTFFYFCIGGNGRCGVKDFNNIMFTAKNYIYNDGSKAEPDICRRIGKDNSSCEDIPFCNWSSSGVCTYSY